MKMGEQVSGSWCLGTGVWEQGTGSRGQGTGIRVVLTVLMMVSVFAGDAFAGGPFASYPGTRARAMAGAFTAVADDASAVWYNPAGLAGKKEIGGVLEWYQAPGIEEENRELDSGENNWFAGAYYEEKEYGIGLFYYRPYTVSYPAADIVQRNAAWGTVDETVQVFSIPMTIAPPVFEGKLKLGGSVEWVNLDVGESQIVYRDLSGFANGYKAADDSDSGFSGSLGILVTAVDTGDLKLNLGGTYRFKSGTEAGKSAMVLESDTAIAELFFEKPASFDAGAALIMGFKGKGSQKYEFTAGIQYGSTDWGDAQEGDSDLKYDNFSFGTELALKDENARISNMAFRAGYFLRNPSGGSQNWDWPDVSGITYGFGISIGNLGIDIAQEYVAFENDSGYDDDVFLTSLALTLTF